MNLIFSHSAWQDYLYWQKTDKAMLKRINKLLEDIVRHPPAGIGKPEPLKYELSSYYSRRINQEHRIIYQPTTTHITLISLRYHYPAR